MNTTQTLETVKTSDLRVGDTIQEGNVSLGYHNITITGIKVETLLSGKKVTRVATNLNPVGSVYGAGQRWYRVIA